MRQLVTVGLICVGMPVLADAPVVTAAVRVGDRIDVTLRHGDTGWDHYADGWRVLGPDGTEIGFRKLLHPHVNEQPFTRSLSGLDIPEGATHLTIVPHDSVHGDGPAFRLELN